MIIGFAQGTTAGLSILTAQAYGARDYRRVRRSFGTSVWITLGISVILTIGAVTMTRPLLTVMQTPPDIMDDSIAFVRVIYFGIIASMSFNLLSNMLRALGTHEHRCFS